MGDSMYFAAEKTVFSNNEGTRRQQRGNDPDSEVLRFM
jgi:hypothetical protein